MTLEVWRRLVWHLLAEPLPPLGKEESEPGKHKTAEMGSESLANGSSGASLPVFTS